MGSFNKKIKKILNAVLPYEVATSPSGLTSQQYEAINQRRALSDQLHYRSYEEVDGIKIGNSKGGLYRMMDGRLGIVYKISPPPFFTEEFENVILSMLGKIVHDDTVIHVFCHSSENISKNIESYKRVSNFSTVNVKNPEVIDYLESVRIKSFKKWAKTSISEKVDIRLRNFNNIISILFPEDTNINDIITISNEIGGTLEKLHPVSMQPEEFLSILKEIWNPDNLYNGTKADKHRKMNTQIAKGSKVRLSEDRSYFTIGKEKIAQTYTTDLFPEELKPLEFQSAFLSPFNDDMQTAIPCPFVMSLSIVFSNVKKNAKKVKEKAQHNIGQLTTLPGNLEKKYPVIKDKRIEAEDTVYYVSKLGEVPINTMFQITTFASSVDESERVGARLIKRFEDIEGMWKLRPETYSMISFQSLVYGCPLSYMKCGVDNLRRHDYLFKSNNAQIAALLSDFKGFGEAHYTYIGPTGQFQQFHPLMFSDSNYNFVITGPMGSGKSYWINDFLLQSFRTGCKIRMVDIGRSYQPQCEAHGGQYLEFIEDNKICLNFFTNIKTQKIKLHNDVTSKLVEQEIPHEDEYSTIIPLIGMMAGVSLSVDLKKTNSTVDDELHRKNIVIAVEQAIRIAFMRKGRSAGLKEVAEALESLKEQANDVSEEFRDMFSKTIFALSDYANEDGKYFSYFNGANNINFDNDFFILELEELLQNKKELLPIVTLAFLQRVGGEAFLDDTTPMVIGVDEAKISLENPLFAEALDDYSRRFRKYKKFLLIATQYISDFFITKKSAALYEGASYKIMLPSGGEAIERAVANKHIMLNDFEKMQVSNIRNFAPDFNQFCMRFKDQNIMCTLKTPKEEMWLFSTSPEHKDRRKTIQRLYGLSMVETALYLSIEEEMGLHGEAVLEEVKIRLNHEDYEKQEKNILKRVKESLSNDSILLYLFPVLDVKTDKITSLEVLSKIKNGEDGLINAASYLNVAKKYELYYEVLIRIALKAFVYFSQNDYNFSLNLEAKDLLNNDFYTFLLQEIKGKNLGDRLSLELSELDEIPEKNMDIVTERIKELKNNNVGIIFDKITTKNFSADIFFEILPDAIKVDGQIIQKLTSSNLTTNEARFVRFLTYGLKSLEIDVISIFVSNDDIQQSCGKLGIERMQGYHIIDPKPIPEKENKYENK